MNSFELLQTAIDNGPISLPVNSIKRLAISGPPIAYGPKTTLTVEHEPGVRTWIHVGGDGIQAHVFPLVNVWIDKFEVTPNTVFACGTKFGTPFREKINVSFGDAAT